jgi:hypothetical protein
VLRSRWRRQPVHVLRPGDKTDGDRPREPLRVFAGSEGSTASTMRSALDLMRGRRKRPRKRDFCRKAQSRPVPEQTLDPIAAFARAKQTAARGTRSRVTCARINAYRPSCPRRRSTGCAARSTRAVGAIVSIERARSRPVKQRTRRPRQPRRKRVRRRRRPRRLASRCARDPAVPNAP